MARTPNKNNTKRRDSSEVKRQADAPSALVSSKPFGQICGDQSAERTLRMIMFGGSEKGEETGEAMMSYLLTEMAPRDPLERMLIQQLAWTHQRIGWFSRCAAATPRLRDALPAHECCERAMNTYRKGMVALKEYRSRPRESPLVAVQQVNNAAEGQTRVAAVPVENRAEPAPQSSSPRPSRRKTKKKEKT